MEQKNVKYIDPEVNELKFMEEVSNFLKIEDKWREKGVFLIRKHSLDLEFLFCIPKIRPSAIAFSVQINFTNYDVEPPSVRFVCPFSRKILTRKEVLVKFLQVKIPQKMDPTIPPQHQIQHQELLQGDLDDIPFFCMPGIREYHDHPAHSGDSWLLYRTKGEGSLGFILDQLYNHSIPFISNYSVQHLIGFSQQINIPSP